MSHLYLFIIGINDSGTTWLQNNLSTCKNCVSFMSSKNPFGIEGNGLVHRLDRKCNYFPNDKQLGIVKMFSEKFQIFRNSKNYNWQKIKKHWNNTWKQNENFKTANPRIFLEKTPSNLLIADILQREFKPSKFIILQRNPYAVCEGMIRTCKIKKKIDYTPERCARHWVFCSQKQMENIRSLKHVIWFKYEDLAHDKQKIRQKINEFIPALNDINFSKPSQSHAMDGGKKRPFTNYNQRHIKNLSKKQIQEMNHVFNKHSDIMRFFNYEYL